MLRVVHGLKKWWPGYCIWIAQGFGVGRIPVAPGTFGTVVGLLWFALLLQTGNFWFYLVGTAAGFGISVWLCGAAEHFMKEKDPGSVVLDEIAAVPACFLSFVSLAWFRDGQWPGLENFFASYGWRDTIAVFILFRIFDVLKPWPVGWSQRLPGGWGVTTDDFLAAIYVAIVTLPLAW